MDSLSRSSSFSSASTPLSTSDLETYNDLVTAIVPFSEIDDLKTRCENILRIFDGEFNLSFLDNYETPIAELFFQFLRGLSLELSALDFPAEIKLEIKTSLRAFLERISRGVTPEQSRLVTSGLFDYLHRGVPRETLSLHLNRCLEYPNQYQVLCHLVDWSITVDETEQSEEVQEFIEIITEFLEIGNPLSRKTELDLSCLNLESFPMHIFAFDAFQYLSSMNMKENEFSCIEITCPSLTLLHLDEVCEDLEEITLRECNLTTLPAQFFMVSQSFPNCNTIVLENIPLLGEHFPEGDCMPFLFAYEEKFSERIESIVSSMDGDEVKDYIRSLLNHFILPIEVHMNTLPEASQMEVTRLIDNCLKIASSDPDFCAKLVSTLQFPGGTNWDAVRDTIHEVQQIEREFITASAEG